MESITGENVKLIQMYDPLNVPESIYRLNKVDNHLESKSDTYTLWEQNGKNITIVEPKDDLWAIGKVAKENIYKGEILLNQRLEIRFDFDESE